MAEGPADGKIDGFLDLDLDRALRRGAPEAVLCDAKSVEQVAAIAAEYARLEAEGHAGLGPVLFTRADADRAAAVLAALPFFIGMFGLWPMAVETLSVIVTAVMLALLFGLPLGVLMAEIKTVALLLRPILDGMQTMPSFVYLIPAMMLFGLGKVPAVLATLIYALPPVIRLTALGLNQVPESVEEAALAYGATRWQLLKEVRLPLAMPSILAGVNQTTMMALAMVVISSMIGAKGLGQEVLLSINRIDVGRGFEAGMSVVFLAIIIDRLTQNLAKRWEPPQG